MDRSDDNPTPGPGSSLVERGRATTRSHLIEAARPACYGAWMSFVGRSLLMTVMLVAPLVGGACSKAPPLMVWVDGFTPEHVSFEVKDLGPLDDAGITVRRRESGADGVMRLPPGSCEGPCQVAEVTIFVANRTTQPEAPPVVRLDVPEGRPRRLPIAFGGAQIDPGRTGRVRWLVERWPGEERLTATLSSSVRLDVSSTTTTPTAAMTTPTALMAPSPTAPTAPTTTMPTPAPQVGNTPTPE